jgi:hypothetical protein
MSIFSFVVNVVVIVILSLRNKREFRQRRELHKTLTSDKMIIGFADQSADGWYVLAPQQSVL